jgi:hypothetical protein
MRPALASIFSFPYSVFSDSSSSFFSRVSSFHTTDFFIILLFVAFAPPVFASDSVDVTIVEGGRITSYFNQYWVVNVDGNVTIANPTARDLFEVSIRFDIGSLAIIDVDSTGQLLSGSINIPRIPANSTVRLPYTIVGISLTDPALPAKGVLYTGLTKFAPVIYSDTFGQLQKANLENENLTGRPGRLISVELRNPTGFQFTINSLRVIKTPQLDPNQILAEWSLVNTTNPLTLSPDQLFVRDILDRDSAEGLVYWLDADVFISRVRFIDVSNVTRYTEMNLSIPPEFLNYTLNETNASNRSALVTPTIALRKVADQQVVVADRPLAVSLVINNYAQRLIDVSVADPLPPGFMFVDGAGWTQRPDGSLSWRGTVSAKNAVVPQYRIRLNDTSTSGFDFLDAARVNYESVTMYSNTVPFIRQFLPTQRLYVQKKIRFEDDDAVAVTITVQNLGSTGVRDVLLKEYLQDADVFSQISVAPDEKGLWSIPFIAPGDTFEVTYYTTRDSQLNFLPNLYGVPNGEILRSLVLENVISSAWTRVRTRSLEIVGVLLLLSLPVLYFVFKGNIRGKGGGGATVAQVPSPSAPTSQQK